MSLTNADFTGNYASGTTAYSGAIYSGSGRLNLHVTSGKSVFTGNVAVMGGSASANSIYLNTGNLTVDTAAGAVLDMRDPMGGNADSGSVTIRKSGDGTWKLGGGNAFTGSHATTFAVDAGALYLYRADEVDNANHNFATTKNAKVEAGSISITGVGGGSFTLGGGATLAVGGGAWSGVAPNSVTATNINIGNGATLAFDLAHHDSNSSNEMLTLTGSVGLAGVSTLTIDLLSLNTTAGAYKLVERSAGDGFDNSITYALTLRGENILNTRAAEAFSYPSDPAAALSIVASTISVEQTGGAFNQVVTWTGADSSNGTHWNITAKNWDGTHEQFLHGDIVNFSNASGKQEIAINPGDGDGTVRAAGMYVSGGADYAFSGVGIELDGANAATTLAGAAANGKLVLGAKATSATAIDTAATFSGTVDLTGTTSNDFKGGVDLRSGSLRIGSAAQLGTALGGVSFLADAGDTAFDDLKDAIRAGASAGTADQAKALRESGVLPAIVIEKNGDAVLNGAGGGSQRMSIASGKAGSFHLEDGAKLTFRDIAYNSVSGEAEGGALRVGDGSLLALTAGDGAGYVFTGNYASGTRAGGGAISNSGTLTLTNADFTGNYASGSMTAYGGAIYNLGGELNLHVTSGESVFTGNVAVRGGTASANSIFFEGSNLIVDTAAGAVLDMRDPMGGEITIGSLTIRKSGGGTWKLGGGNVFTGGNATTFAVDAGTLYLYRADEVDNANPNFTATKNAKVKAGGISIDGSGGGSFILGDGATLAVGGVGHAISVSSGTIALAGDLAFDMTEATTSTRLTLTANAIATTSTGAKIGSGDIHVSEFAAKAAVANAGDTYTLVDTDTSADTTVNTGALHVDGNRHYVDRASADLQYGLAVGGTDSILQIKFIDTNSAATALTWTGADGSDWNTDDPNWYGEIGGVAVNHFLNKDEVTFSNTVNGVAVTGKTVDVDAGGVEVKSMAVDGTGYTFGLAASASAPAITVTGSVATDLNGAVLKITGYNPAADVNPFDTPRNVLTIIKTNNGVSNFNDAISVAGQTAANAFLTAYAYLDGNDVKVETGLYWYSTDPARKAHGTFNIAGGETFTLGAELKDNSASANLGSWDGNSLTKEGDGTLVLTADNSYTGATTVNAGTLQIGNGGASGNIAGDIVNHAAVVFNRGDDSAYGGEISGGGTLTKKGGGILTLSGTSDYSGATTITAGTLRLTGSLTGSTSLTIGADGMFDMAGAGGVAFTSLAVAAGSALATGGKTLDLTANGSAVTFNLAGAAGVNPVLAVTGGGLAVSADTRVVLENPAGLAVGDRILLASAATGAATETTITSGRWKFNLEVTGGELWATIAGAASYADATNNLLGPLAPGNINIRNGGAHLDRLANQPYGQSAGMTAIDNYFTKIGNDLAGNYSAIASELQRFYGAYSAYANQALADDANRFRQRWRRQNHFFLDGFLFSDPLQGAAGGGIGSDSALASPRYGARERVPAGSSRVWAGGFGTWAKQDSRSGLAGYDYDSRGLALGYEYSRDRLHAGVAAAYSRGKLEVDDLGYDNKPDVLNLALHGAYVHDSGVYLEGGLGYGHAWNDYRADMLLGGKKTGKYGSDTFSADLEAGYVARLAHGFNLVPSVGVEYAYLRNDSWKEKVSGHSTAPANRFAAGHDHALDIPVGLRANRAFVLGNGSVVVPEVRAAYVYTANKSRPTVQSGFAGAPGGFDVHGVEPGRGHWRFGGGLSGRIGRVEVHAEYEFETRSGFRAHNVNASVGVAF